MDRPCRLVKLILHQRVVSDCFRTALNRIDVIVQRSLALLFFKRHFFSKSLQKVGLTVPLPGDTPYNGLYEEAPLEKGYLSLIELYGG